jgi:hypothetical protein
MEAVARARAALPQSQQGELAATSASINLEPSWVAFKAFQPGLLQMSVGGRISDLLGLGDVIFPAILISWARRSDQDSIIPKNILHDQEELPHKESFRVLEVFLVSKI